MKERVILGKELADARNAEARRKEAGGGAESPLPARGYDFWRGDLSLIDPTPSKLDDEIRHVCRRYAQSDPDRRLATRRSISMDQFYTLIGFAKRSSVFAMRHNNRNLIADGLTAIAMIERERVDNRDVLWCLGLLGHAAEKTGGNVGELFRAAADLAEAPVAEILSNFPEQTPEYRDLRASWGYGEVHTDNGVGFIGWGYDSYDPTLDLTSAAIDIANLIASDDYQPSQIELATELPGVWLGGPNAAGLLEILSSIRGTATVNASLRPDKHPDHAGQQFTVFLAETADDADAQSLCRMAESDGPPKHCKLALAQFRLFCLVIARAFVDGVDAYEADDSLARFSGRITEILNGHQP